MLTSLFNLFIIICLLYVFYRVVGQYILPNLSRRRLERYKQKFFEENQHISSEKKLFMIIFPFFIHGIVEDSKLFFS